LAHLLSTTREDEGGHSDGRKSRPPDRGGELGVGRAAGRARFLAASGRAGPGDRAGDRGAGVGVGPPAEV